MNDKPNQEVVASPTELNPALVAKKQQQDKERAAKKEATTQEQGQAHPVP
jgi:hypothetical protein